ncbi:MAG: HAMP domain-containing histidine kinase [Clostridia bacterium]|nr:HAMP domain-containing histidine kinase [Clostridia bacterium]
MIKTLRRKFVLIAMLSVTAVLLLIVGTINISNYHTVVEDADLRLSFLAEDGGEQPNAVLPEEIPSLEPLPDLDGNRRNRWRDERGGFFDREGRLGAETPFDSRYFTVVLNENGAVTGINTGRISAVDAETAQQMALALYEKGKTSGFSGNYRYMAETADGGTRYIFVDVSRELNTFYSFLTASLLVSALGLGLVFLLVLFFSKKALKPVEESLVKQKRFITDASHELKTPMAVISAANEVIELENGESEWTESIDKQIKRLSGLTDKLVLLTRMDEESYRPVTAPFDLSAAVNETVDSFEAVAQLKNLPIRTDIAPGISVDGDETAIRQLVSLLTDNALKYGVGNLAVTLKKSGKNAVLTVENDAENVQKGDLSVFFERFYRTDASRNSATGGHGIGLSVAEAIVHAHKGKITANSPDGKRVVITVTL